MKVVYDRLLVRKLEGAEKSKGGIIIPITAREHGVYGEVVAAGAGFVLQTGQVVPLTVKVGDKVLLGKNVGTVVTVDGEEFISCWERDVLVIL